MDAETISRGFQWYEILLMAWGLLGAVATATPTKKDDEVKTKVDKAFNFVSAIGIDLKLVKRALFPEK